MSVSDSHFDIRNSFLWKCNVFLLYKIAIFTNNNCIPDIKEDNYFKIKNPYLWNDWLDLIGQIGL